MSQTRKGRRYAAGLDDSGWALKRIAPKQKHVAHALGLDQPRVSRMIRGELPSNVSRFYDDVRSAVLDSRADAGALIAGAMAVAEDAAYSLGQAECRRRALDHLAQETIAQAAEDVAEQRLAYMLGANEDDAEIRAAYEDYDEKVRGEMSSEVNALVYLRAFARHKGWRQAP